jgi:hypothetical protein
MIADLSFGHLVSGFLVVCHLAVLRVLAPGEVLSHVLLVALLLGVASHSGGHSRHVHLRGHFPQFVGARRECG